MSGDPPFPFGYPYPTHPWPGETGHPGCCGGRSWASPVLTTLPPPSRLSDEDVERIAQRVMEIIRAAPICLPLLPPTPPRIDPSLLVDDDSEDDAP